MSSREELCLNKYGCLYLTAAVWSFRGGEVGAFKPGQYVPKSGVYSVYHRSHRLMHRVTLLADQRFPSCRQCENQVRFEFHRSIRDGKAFYSGELLKEYSDSDALPKPRKIAG